MRTRKKICEYSLFQIFIPKFLFHSFSRSHSFYGSGLGSGGLRRPGSFLEFFPDHMDFVVLVQTGCQASLSLTTQTGQ